MQISKQSPPFADDIYQTTATAMIFFIYFKMFGNLRYSLTKTLYLGNATAITYWFFIHWYYAINDTCALSRGLVQ